MTRVFISYSHRDEPLRAELDKHFALLKRQGALDVWSDHRIPPGGEVDASISEGLESADVILLLISADFIASDYCFSVEMNRAMERHVSGDCVVVPVILRPCDWQSAPFGGLKAIPADGRAITKWPSQDEALEDIVKHVRKLLAKPGRSESPKPAALATGIAQTLAGATPTVARVGRSSNLSLPREFSDQDKHDFTQSTFDYIREYFDGSLAQLKERNQQVQARITVLSPRAFTAVIFRHGKRIAACHVRIGGAFSTNGIAYSSNENTSENSFNELLSVEADKQTLYLKATMGMFNRASESKLSEEGAAEHLWSILISPLQ